MRLLLVLTAVLLLQACSSFNISSDKDKLVSYYWAIPEVGKADKYFSFDKDKQVSGFLGCNVFRGSVAIKGNKINFSQLVTTKRACFDKNKTQAEQSMIKALENARYYEINENKLTLKDGNNKPLMDFEAFSDGSFREE